MNKKSVYLALAIVFLVLFAAVMLLAVTSIIDLNMLYSLISLVACAVFAVLYFKEKNSDETEPEFISAERERKQEKPKYIRDFEIVRDCCESIVKYLKEDRNVVGITLTNSYGEFEGYYSTKIDTFEFLDCLYVHTDEEIETLAPEVLAVLEDAFLARKFSGVDAKSSGDNVFFFKRDDETFHQTFYVYAENHDAFKNFDYEVEKLDGYWYYVKYDKKLKDLLNS